MSSSNTATSKFLLASVESDVLSLIQDSLLKKKVKAVFVQYSKSLDGLQIKMQSILSSTVNSIGYDLTTETLRVEFLTGSVYDYLKVPQSVFTDLRASKSVGQFMNEKIKPNYGTIKIKD